MRPFERLRFPKNYKLLTIFILIIFVLSTQGMSLGELLFQAKALQPQVDYYEEAKTFLSQSDYASAVSSLTEHISGSMGQAPVMESYRLRGLAYHLLGEYPAAVGDWLIYLEHVPEDAEIHYLLGTIYTATHQEAQALESFSRALEENGEMAAAYSERSVLLFNRGDYAGALLDLNLAIQLTAKDSHLYLNRGKVHLLLGRHREALADFNHAISFSNENIEAFLHRGNSYLAMAEYVSAVEDFSRVIVSEKGYELTTEALNRRGLALYLLGEYESAIADWERSLNSNPEDAQIHYWLGLTYYDLGNYLRSIEYLTNTTALNEGRGDAYHKRANAYVLLGRYDEAVTDYTMAIERVQTGQDTLYFNRGVAYLNLKKRQLATADFNEVMAVTTDEKLASEARKALKQIKNQ